MKMKLADVVVDLLGLCALFGILYGVDNVITRRAYNRDRELEEGDDAVSLGWRKIGFSLLLLIFALVVAFSRSN
jgi:hypothetical protein